MATATLDDLETSLMRELNQTEHMYVQALLERAENLLLTRIDDLKDRVTEDEPFKALVAATEAEAVAHVFRNPDALRQESEGNYSYSVNFQVASGLLDILDIEWQRDYLWNPSGVTVGVTPSRTRTLNQRSKAGSDR